MFYVIVRKAMDGFWETEFKVDPKTNPVGYSLSAYYSYLGQSRCKIWYSEDKVEMATEACERLNRLDPDGGYAICQLKE